VSDLWTKAIEAAEDARMLFDAGRYNSACNRAYYAMFNAARALLIDKAGLAADAVKRHATVLRLFSQHFVERGPFDTEIGRLLRRASDARLVADYDVTAVRREEATTVIEAMEQFMASATPIQAGDNG
jgi:uncharacterized protein